MLQSIISASSSVADRVFILMFFLQFDYLKSLEIEEKINKVKWCVSPNGSRFILSTNDKTIKLWKVWTYKLLNYHVIGGHLYLLISRINVFSNESRDFIFLFSLQVWPLNFLLLNRQRFLLLKIYFG